ncbi:hypothetical protein GGD41_003802 [Paraburkholderia bryophila]|uniref:Uncharacterized protein n=1 Tax=Paraburkholderia bryophila TaxID=420952 RepID=A0A7Y9W998_9BURK|nr:hypothetical protein [Paraburkholderia bryophila]NYH24992.1 hypothetical protein [Paraburkholderia bryophila]
MLGVCGTVTTLAHGSAYDEVRFPPERVQLATALRGTRVSAEALTLVKRNFVAWDQSKR